MSTWSSERGLRVAALAAVLGIGLASVAFFVVQNRLALPGGDVALSKSVWLGVAILFWIVLPLLVLSDRRIAPPLLRPFFLLIVLMALRAAGELWMLYVLHNWSPIYGIAHDLACMATVWGACARAWLRRRDWLSRDPDRAVFVHALFTGLLFIPEMYFAWYMHLNFRTSGDNPVYFVPDTGMHSLVLNVTAAVDVVAILYLVWFLYAWFYGKAQGVRARPARS